MSNLLPLETFRQQFGFHPFHFWGQADTTLLAVDTGCDTLVRQYPWQNSDAASRTDIIRAIETAEQQLQEHLGYWPAPTYLSETHPWPAHGADWGRWWSIQLDSAKIQAVGVETLTLISAAAAVTLSDTDGDGYNDTFTVGPIVTTVTDAKEIAAYFAVADRFAGPDFTPDVGEHWRIQPLIVSISGGSVTIKGPAWLLVKPIKYEGVTNIGSSGLNPATAANLVTTLDLYRRWTNPDGTTSTTAEGVIVWETRPSHGWWCCCSGCAATTDPFSGSPYDPAATALAAARVGLRDAEHGIVGIGEASYDATTGIFSALDWTVCGTPDRAVVRYLAGEPLGTDGQMARIYQTVVARLAAAELARPVCGCADANRSLFYWQFDMARSSGNADEAYGAISPTDLDNPFGSRRGHIYAWKFIRHRQQLHGFLA